jgi:hypothetical protein
LLTPLSSPERSISAHKQVSLSILILIFEDKIAETTAKSMAVSSILMPPVILTNTSLTPILNPAFF